MMSAVVAAVAIIQATSATGLAWLRATNIFLNARCFEYVRAATQKIPKPVEAKSAASTRTVNSLSISLTAAKIWSARNYVVQVLVIRETCMFSTFNLHSL